MSWWTPTRQAFAANYLVQRGGLSRAGAAGLVSRFANVEAPGGPASMGGYKGRAFGIGQWLGSRRAPILGNTSFTGQLDYVIKELNGRESAAGRVLKSATTLKQGAIGASMYERAGGYAKLAPYDNYTGKSLAGSDETYNYAFGGSPGGAAKGGGVGNGQFGLDTFDAGSDAPTPPNRPNSFASDAPLPPQRPDNLQPNGDTIAGAGESNMQGAGVAGETQDGQFSLETFDGDTGYTGEDGEPVANPKDNSTGPLASDPQTAAETFKGAPKDGDSEASGSMTTPQAIDRLTSGIGKDTTAIGKTFSETVKGAAESLSSDTKKVTENLTSNTQALTGSIDKFGGTIDSVWRWFADKFDAAGKNLFTRGAFLLLGFLFVAVGLWIMANQETITIERA